MTQKLKEILGDIKNDPTLQGNLTESSDIINDVGIDSLQMIYLMLKVEEEFGVEIDFETFDYQHLSSISAFAGFISQCQKEGA